jgi:hypothetical protein
MKRILLLLLTALSLASKAQVYNNEWIDYSKTYYKFKVGETGLYHISQPVLASIGLGATPAENFQLWRNGQEIAIYTSVQTGTMGGSDFIEFYGEMNDGKPDNVLYRFADYQLCDKWSLQTDTASFFLTVNPAGNNLRSVPTLNDVASNTLAPEPYFMCTTGTYYHAKVNSGRSELVGDSYTYSSSYDYGEGWTSLDIANGGTQSANYSNLYVYSGAGAPTPVVKVNAAGNAVHTRYFRVTINGDSVLGSDLNYYDYIKASGTFNISLLSGNYANLDITNMGTEASDRMVIASSEIIYPRRFDLGGFGNFSFALPANPAGNYLEIAGFAYSGGPPVLYDLTNHTRYVADMTNPLLLKFALLPSSVDRKLVLESVAGIHVFNITTIQPRNFVNYGLPANQGNYLIISHPYLLNGANGTNPIDDYRAYRSSPEGGSYNAKIYMIDDLNDQFGLGIKKNPLSIRNFIGWARATYTEPLKDVLLIGKGVVYNQFDQNEGDPNMDKLDLVPTFGYPASDNMLSAAPGTSTPLTPVGRISAITPAEVAIYLQKVKEYETLQTTSSPLIADRSWMKEIIHVVGAGDEQTADILSTALHAHQKIIEDTLYGGHVTNFSKNSASYVEQADNEKLISLINGGVGILTYFGHSSSSTLEFNLDDPGNYSNAGKYPVFIVMGCNAGNFYNFNVARFTTYETLSEKYVLAPERGSIAFLASTHLGIVHYLDIYNTQTYTAASVTKYGMTLGEIRDEAISKVFGITSENDFYARFQCEQFTLHGDPAVRLYNFPKPDYAIEDQMVKISPSFITVGSGTFNIKASVINLGRAISDSVTIEVKRTYPNTTTPVVILRKKLSGIRFMDSINIDVNILPPRDKGLNKITVTIDPDNTIPELYETNNTVTKDVFIFEDEARPVYPYNFSIVSQQNIKLVASSANAFAVSRDYFMEIDTTELFNSPSKVSRTVTSSGGVFDFTPGITFADSTVYYWRVAPAAPAASIVWNKASFIYLAGSDAGFNQSHLYQHMKSQFDQIRLDSISRKFYFGNRNRNIFVRSGVFPTAVSQAAAFSVSVDGDANIQSVCGVANVVFNVFDPVSLRPWFNSWGGPGQFGSDDVCGADRAWNFQYNIQDSVKRRKIVEFMDMIPDGFYVVVRNCSYSTDQYPSLANTYPPTWQADAVNLGIGNTMYDRLRAQGFTTIDSFNRPRVFVFVYRKNDNTFNPQTTFSLGIYDAITLSVDLQTPDTLGYITSPLFGPAKGWKQLHWRGNTIDSTGGDAPLVSVVGIDNDGIETPLITNLSTTQQDYDISSINAQQFPYLKLKMRNQDSLNLTPYQLKYWRLTYIPVPEGAIAPNLYFTTKDTVEVGEPVNFGIGFKNVSNVDFDSIKVKFTITDRNNLDHTQTVRLKKLLTTAPNDTVKVEFPIVTDGLSGLNTITVNFNPDNDQPEQYLFNNLAYRNLYVRPDSLHPVLDVTFDGVHILNRDIVSSKPTIVVKLKDEAKWLVLDDTSLLNVQVRFPDGSLHRYSFSSSDTLQFIPAGQAPNPQNVATINFKPDCLQDGDYELIVDGKDRSNNNAGNIQYRVGFQVLNKPMISNMLNYPNPFTTSTAFVFTITGSEVPQNIRIQILTITGKIVRDITKDELGSLHIGRNITEFKWDGTDQYGSKLANGIYLYRVITNLNGKSLDKYKAEGDNTDKYFNKGYGKMYLMR